MLCGVVYEMKNVFFMCWGLVIHSFLCAAIPSKNPSDVFAEISQNLKAVIVLLYDEPGVVRSRAQLTGRSKADIISRLQRVNYLLYDKDTTYRLESYCEHYKIDLSQIEALHAKCIFDLGQAL